MLIILNKTNSSNFQVQAQTIISFLICFNNIMLMLFYCRYTGSSYISREHYRNFRYIMCVALYWSLSLIGKQIQSGLPEFNLNLVQDNSADGGKTEPKKQIDEMTTWDAALIFVMALAFDITPYILIVEREFIKIFTFDMLFKHINRMKEHSLYDRSSQLRQNENRIIDKNSPVDPQSILQGEFGPEIMKIKHQSSTIPNVMSVSSVSPNFGMELQFENPRFFMLTADNTQISVAGIGNSVPYAPSGISEQSTSTANNQHVRTYVANHLRIDDGKLF